MSHKHSPSIQKFSSHEQIAEIYKLQAIMQLQRFDVLFIAHLEDVIPQADTYEALTFQEAAELIVWLKKTLAEDADLIAIALGVGGGG